MIWYDYFYLPDPLDLPVDPTEYYDSDDDYPRENDCE